MTQRHYTFLDRICLRLDEALRALTDNAKTTGAAYPGRESEEQNLTSEQRKQSAAFMRINHAGEICAQGLYHGQGVVSHSQEVQKKMQAAAMEEGNHLAWCRKRLDELGSHPSYLNPLWYAGSFCIGMVAGMIGDKWSLGFVAETERQVIQHLKGHLQTLATEDQRSYVILEQMQADEARHHDDAVHLGANELPQMIRKGMALTSKIMVKTANWV